MAERELKTGLVLTGGGARAAYQVGCLRAIAEITGFKENPFAIISGFSAGAINGAWLASRSEDFQSATRRMWDAWAHIEAAEVFRTDSASLARIGLQWLRSRTIGGLNPGKQITYLLDTAPLADLLAREIDFEQLEENIRRRKLRGLAIVAANYHTGKSTAFFAGGCDIKNWEGHNKVSVRCSLSAEHILASAAIPVFFRPVRIGDSFYGDGMVRLSAPLAPAIHMGADRLLVIGVKAEAPNDQPGAPAPPQVTLSEIAGTILNGLFFDSLDNDLSRLDKINRSIAAVEKDGFSFEAAKLKSVPYLSIKPSRPMGTAPGCELSKFPFAIRFLLQGLGVSDQTGADLMSYLAFESTFTTSLLEQGFADTQARAVEIREFFGMRAAGARKKAGAARAKRR